MSWRFWLCFGLLLMGIDPFTAISVWFFLTACGV
jgi:hypothetical protein